LLWLFQPFGVFFGLASVPFRLPFGMSMFSPQTVATSGRGSGVFQTDAYFLKKPLNVLNNNNLIYLFCAVPMRRREWPPSIAANSPELAAELRAWMV
jgi:hypothetical protein